jgi:hypothetical protein
MADRIPILRVGVLRFGIKVGITVVGIDAEDREAGAASLPLLRGRDAARC